MALIGSVGLGLVWGWWLGLTSRHGAWQRPFRPLFLLLLPTLMAAALLWALVDGQTAVLFLAALIFSLFIHLSWRQKLAQEL